MSQTAEPQPAVAVSPEVRIAPMNRRDEAHALGVLYDTLLAVRWHSQVHPSLNPYHAVMVLLKGQRVFEAEYIADLDAVCRIDPSIAGRVDGRGLARRARRELVQMVARWSERRLGRVRPLREIADIFERLWQPPPVVPKLKDAVFELEEYGPGAGHIDAFRSSGMVRKGTLHELAEDLAHPEARRIEHEMIDREIEAEEKGEEKPQWTPG